MQDSFSTLFQKPGKAYGKSFAEESWKSKALAIVLFPIVVPALLVGAAISIPWTHIMRVKQRRDEARFGKQMNVAGRFMDWTELKSMMGDRKGTAIGEYLSTKGPFRLWWTPDDIPATSPHKWEREQHVALPEPELLPFFQWCYARYTNPESGLAQLVPVPEEERKQLKAMLTRAHFVSTCSFRSLRESHSVKVVAG